ncbi:MAG: hypothetical protein NPIRA03_24630 [Nitrospirales bacterium]|nr:MAG: hypothetical protein NPIRA03_24630 [Nitrospirales bacterium]
MFHQPPNDDYTGWFTDPTVWLLVKRKITFNGTREFRGKNTRWPDTMTLWLFY